MVYRTARCGLRVSPHFYTTDDELDAFLSESLRTGGYDVAFPVVHGAVGEDGALQGLLPGTAPAGREGLPAAEGAAGPGCPLPRRAGPVGDAAV